jgi:hypothetical protein
METKCVGIKYITDCINAGLGNGCYICKYSGVCEYQRPRKSVEQYRGKRMEDKTIYECNECLLEDTEVPCRKVTSEKIDKKHCPFDEYLVANWKAILEANSQKGVRDEV